MTSGPRPTLLISPAGLQILDVLYRHTQVELEHFPSALKFAQTYKLRQWKLSPIMTALKARTLSELKRKVRDLSATWWTNSLHYPLTRKRLTPFFEVCEPYQPLHPSRKNLSVEKVIKEAKELEIYPGPPEQARRFGMLRDSNLYLWVAEKDRKALKARFKLVPSDGSSSVEWVLASPQRSFLEEAIITPYDPDQLNEFRCIWDLARGDERMNEVITAMLEELMHEV